MRGGFKRDLRRWRRRSRLVRAARLALPVAVVALLGSAIGQVVWRTMTAAERGPEKPQSQIRMLNPRFYGQSNDGRAFLITARSAVRDDADLKRVLLDDPTMTLGIDEPKPSRVTSKSGVYREDNLKLVLRGDVRMDDGGGYRFASDEAFVDTKTGVITGESVLQGEGPTGQVKSNAYSVYDKGDRIVFRGGVRTRLDRVGGDEN
ncbi:LPS export ABC transporter periplasmic protein LptC [Caulobacter hibisci]|uniref:LPS export ABC transporter periplasmic protein LptC n=2 Tax=Caulobacter hibisci TaxID=2035993 RepID=A0ABS0SUD1_9CAUL|nr:LPS export ABC transporter periplasmic protein LptC [Caulobacter hibisci]MBI1683260.1 LPS export ABC transporter periplasmic protein LptC [Caulobacter hibisci]